MPDGFRWYWSPIHRRARPTLSSKRGTDELMRVAKVKGWPSLYLKDDDKIAQYLWMTATQRAGVLADGELNFDLPPERSTWPEGTWSSVCRAACMI